METIKTDTINNIREQLEKIKEVVKLQEFRNKGINNNRQTRQLNKIPYAERLIK